MCVCIYIYIYIYIDCAVLLQFGSPGRPFLGPLGRRLAVERQGNQHTSQTCWDSFTQGQPLVERYLSNAWFLQER